MKIVIISAIWCPSCLVMRSRYIEIQSQFPDIDFKFYDVDLDEESSTYNAGDILPALILIDKDNKELLRSVGEQKTEVLTKLIEDCFDIKE